MLRGGGGVQIYPPEGLGEIHQPVALPVVNHWKQSYCKRERERERERERGFSPSINGTLKRGSDMRQGKGFSITHTHSYKHTQLIHTHSTHTRHTGIYTQ